MKVEQEWNDGADFRAVWLNHSTKPSGLWQTKRSHPT